MKAAMVRIFVGAAVIVFVAVSVIGCRNIPSTNLGKWLSVVAPGNGGELPLDTLVAGLKQALEVGTGNAVRSTSADGGYSRNPLIRIPLPEKVQGMATALRRLGLGAQVDDFELKMNQSAELAAREAAPVFLDAIKRMTFADARQILSGGDTAATEYFRKATAGPLKARYMPIVTSQMDQLGSVKAYRALEARYNQIPLVPKMSYEIEDYVADKALDGLFTVLAQEETRIRRDPAARTTELLRRVFGQ